MAGSGGDDSFVEMLYEEVTAEGLDCPSVDMLIDMASAGDHDTVADALGYLTEMGSPHLAAGVLQRIIKAAASKSEGEPDYGTVAQVLGRMIDSGNLQVALEVCKFLLVARDNGNQNKVLDCLDITLIVGHMVKLNKPEWAGKLLFSIYSIEDQSPESSTFQTLVPFILGTLIDHQHIAWAVEIGKQLMYVDLEDIEDGADDFDYSVMGWCLAQMVWFGRADWAAKICTELEKGGLVWYEHNQMMASIASWGDMSYSQTVENFMKDAPKPADLAPSPKPK